MLFLMIVMFVNNRVVLFFQDNVIFERLTDASQYKELTVSHLEQFATEGRKEGRKLD